MKLLSPPFSSLQSRKARKRNNPTRKREKNLRIQKPLLYIQSHPSAKFRNSSTLYQHTKSQILPIKIRERRMAASQFPDKAKNRTPRTQSSPKNPTKISDRGTDQIPKNSKSKKPKTGNSLRTRIGREATTDRHKRAQSCEG